MFNKIFNKNKAIKKLSIRDTFWDDFLLLPHHEWIKENKYIIHSFQKLFALISDGQLEKIRHEKIYFLKANALYSCSISLQDKCNIIMVFPDLQRMLQALVPDKGLAILAHELGHILNQHYARPIETLKSQIEADRYVIDLGLGLELQEVLLDYPDSAECRNRLYALGQYLYPENNN